MIVDSLTQYHLYQGKHELLDKAIEYIKKADFSSLTPKTYEVNGDELFFNLIEYETKPEEERFWESHKKYIDLHYLLEGTELIGYEQFERLGIKQDYDENDDYYLLEGNVHSKVQLQKGDFMVLYPNDAHMTAIKVKESEKVRKIVFKVQL
jgi:biofilm protein TabA